MLNVTKKTVSVLLIFILSAGLSSCRYETRVDFSELIRRMNRDSDTYTLDIKDAFYSEGEWFLFADTLNEADILITAKEDEDKIIYAASANVINSSTEGQKEIFSEYCKRLIKAFTENYDTEKIIDASGVCNTEAFFTDDACFSENGRFSTSLYTSELGCSFFIEIKDTLSQTSQIQ